MAIPIEVLDALMKDYKGPGDITGPNGLLKELTKALVERAMQAEMTDRGPVEVEIPRDRDGAFEPIIVPEHQREFKGLDDKILSLYARGMTTREITEHLKEIYHVEVSPEFIGRVTDSCRRRLQYSAKHRFSGSAFDMKRAAVLRLRAA